MPTSTTPTPESRAVIGSESRVTLGLIAMIGVPVVANVGLGWSNRTDLRVMNARIEALQSTVARIDAVESQRVSDIERQMNEIRIQVAGLKAVGVGD